MTSSDIRYPTFFSAPLAEPTPVKFYDLREEQTWPIPKSMRRRGETVMRGPRSVNGIGLHQMGIAFSVNERQLAQSDGDADLAKARRFMNVPGHANVSLDGFWMIHAPLEAYLNHGNKLNSFTLGLEIEGLYNGRVNEDKMNNKTLEASKAALKYLVDEGRKLGMPIEFIYAHRQSSAMKRGDPGAEIWQKLVLDYAVPDLGLKVRNDYTVGSGRPIPKEWDPENGIRNY